MQREGRDGIFIASRAYSGIEGAVVGFEGRFQAMGSDERRQDSKCRSIEEHSRRNLQVRIYGSPEMQLHATSKYNSATCTCTLKSKAVAALGSSTTLNGKMS